METKVSHKRMTYRIMVHGCERRYNGATVGMRQHPRSSHKMHVASKQKHGPSKQTTILGHKLQTSIVVISRIVAVGITGRNRSNV